MTLRENLTALGKLILAAATGSVFGVFTAIFWIAMQEGTTLHPADNYGPKGTWYHLVFNDQVDFKGSSGRDMVLVLGGIPQNDCHSIKNYGDVSDGKSVRLYDSKNPDAYLPQGMTVYLYWGRHCSDWRPYGIITVPANAKEVLVPNLNKPSPNYQVFNNYKQKDGGDRELGGHVFGIDWTIPL